MPDATTFAIFAVVVSLLGLWALSDSNTPTDDDDDFYL